MNKEIKYNGLSAVPSDYNCLDGDMAVAVNIVSEDGVLKPIAQPAPLLYLSSGQNVIHIHETSSFTHYIVQDADNILYWCTQESQALRRISSFGGVEIFQITSIGNTLVALCSDGMHYMLWKAENNRYTYLGNKIPECPISFGLQGLYSLTEEFEITYDNLSDMLTPFRELSEENKKKITEQVLAKVNAFIAEQSTGNGRFLFPFFVRYAYRLYDGSLSHHSAPILMIPSTITNPIVPVIGAVGTTSSKLKVFGVPAQLDYQALASSSALAQLKNWGDIVKSVDIFISAPLYSYDQSGEITNFTYGAYESFFYGKYGHQTTYNIQSLTDIYKAETGEAIQYAVKLPTKPYKDLCSDIADCGQFYFLESIEINKLSSSRIPIYIESSYLQSLVNREVMTDDYQTHDTLIPSFAQVYNNRLNIANIERKMFEGYDTASMVCYINGSTSAQGDTLATGQAFLHTHLSTPDGVFDTSNTCSLPLTLDPQVFCYLFYPDTTAKRMALRPEGLDGEVEVGDGVTALYSPYLNAPLKEHPHLNGSVYFSGFTTKEWDSPFPAPSLSSNPVISIPNKIYTSEVNNPFYFPLLGINTIGTGAIMGISTAAKALSEGQFGQYPLYAFTSDGVWALEVSATGTYSAKQPITRDLCLGSQSITQIDSAVLFATARGIMLLSGSESICITDILDSETPFKTLDLPQGDRVVDVANLAASNVDIIPFKEYVQGCRMAYDYINQRIHVIHPDHRYAYVYSMDSKSWGMAASDIVSVLNSYPEALAMDRYNRLVDLSTPSQVADIPCLFITRPLKIDSPDVLKTISSIIQRGDFHKGAVKAVLYGSRDLINWHTVFSSTDHYLRGFSGTPYKYFRIAVIGNLNFNESISGCSVEFDARQTNQQR